MREPSQRPRGGVASPAGMRSQRGGVVPNSGFTMTAGVVAFVDYENARWHALRLYNLRPSLPLDPWTLMSAVCDGAKAGKLTKVHVYLGKPNPTIRDRCDYYRGQPAEGWPQHGDKLSVRYFDISPRGEAGEYLEIKEKDIQMSVDIFNWVSDVADRGAEALETAILFSDDRELGPVLRKVDELWDRPSNAPHIDLAGWAATSANGGEIRTILSVDDLGPRGEHVIDWQAYQRASGSPPAKPAGTRRRRRRQVPREGCRDA